MNTITIKSLLDPTNIRYRLEDSSYRSNLLTHSFMQYEVMGDGECQHTPSYDIGACRFTDFCLSVAQYLIDNPDAEIHSFQVCCDPIPTELWDFLRSVKYSETTRKWFCLQLRKVSSNESKRYDKRWMEVPKWANGEVKSALDLYWYGMQDIGNPALLRRYYVFHSIREYAGGSFFQMDTCEEWSKQLAGDYDYAFRALITAMEAKESRWHAKRYIECATANTARKAELAKEQESKAA